jgi:very-short-patch-repair endonuclease
VRDAQVFELAAAQFNRVSRDQLLSLGWSANAIAHRVEHGRLVLVEIGVYALAPVLAHEPWGRWMAATLTTEDSVLSHASAGAAWGVWRPPRAVEIVTRPGNGGPRRHGGVLVHRSSTIAQHRTTLHGIPITSVERTVIDLATHISARSLARLVRESVRLELTSVAALADAVGAHRRRRGARAVTGALARYSGLPLERARSGAEVRAMEILRDARYALPRLNVVIAGEEADLSWTRQRLIIEVDGTPFHLDRGEDLRKQRRWESAGWSVRRISADAIYSEPAELIRLVAAMNVPPTGL